MLKRASQSIALFLVGSAAVLHAFGKRHANVNQEEDDGQGFYSATQPGTGSHGPSGYHSSSWWLWPGSSHSSSYIQHGSSSGIGSHGTSSIGTSRGGFGSSGHAASHGGSS